MVGAAYAAARGQRKYVMQICQSCRTLRALRSAAIRSHCSSEPPDDVSQDSISFKGRVMSLTVLQLQTSDPARIGEAVAAEVARAPGLFAGLPVLIDPNLHDADLAQVTETLRGNGLMPVAVLDADAKYSEAASAAGLGTMRPPAQDNQRARSQSRPSARIVSQPVRSGQQLYARDTDLIVLASVSPGAEVLADGCVHVYGALRGRAMAGCRGDTEAQIFCQQLDAELLAIAGNYRVADDIDDAHRDQPARIVLDGEKLIINSL